MPGSKSQAWPSQPVSEGGLSCVELARPDPGHLVGPQANLGPIKAHLATGPKTSVGGKEFWISDIFRNWLLRGEMGDIQGKKICLSCGVWAMEQQQFLRKKISPYILHKVSNQFSKKLANTSLYANSIQIGFCRLLDFQYFYLFFLPICSLCFLFWLELHWQATNK